VRRGGAGRALPSTPAELAGANRLPSQNPAAARPAPAGALRGLPASRRPPSNPRPARPPLPPTPLLPRPPNPPNPHNSRPQRRALVRPQRRRDAPQRAGHVHRRLQHHQAHLPRRLWPRVPRREEEHGGPLRAKGNPQGGRVQEEPGAVDQQREEHHGDRKQPLRRAVLLQVGDWEGLAARLQAAGRQSGRQSGRARSRARATLPRHGARGRPPSSPRPASPSAASPPPPATGTRTPSCRLPALGRLLSAPNKPTCPPTQPNLGQVPNPTQPTRPPAQSAL
jgi:hypothetical protein